MLGKEAIVARDAKEFDVRGFSNKKSFNCVGPPPPAPCYCGGPPRPVPRPPFPCGVEISALKV